MHRDRKGSNPRTYLICELHAITAVTANTIEVMQLRIERGDAEKFLSGSCQNNFNEQKSVVIIFKCCPFFGIYDQVCVKLHAVVMYTVVHVQSPGSNSDTVCGIPVLIHAPLASTLAGFEWLTSAPAALPLLNGP